MIQTTPVAREKMFQLSEEQAEEIQVLESIYGDAFTRNSFKFRSYLFLQMIKMMCQDIQLIWIRPLGRLL